jgi:hypothetical protein
VPELTGRGKYTVAKGVQCVASRRGLNGKRMALVGGCSPPMTESPFHRIGEKDLSRSCMTRYGRSKVAPDCNKGR